MLTNIRAKLASVILACVLFSGCANTRFLIFGVDINEIKGKDFGVAALGVATSIGTHVLGHHIAAKLCDVDIKQDGFNEEISYANNPSSSDMRWVGRGGFLFQLLVNTALVEFANDSYFTKGFTGATCMELLTYDLLNRDEYNDFNFIDENNGNGNTEHGLYTLWSAYNFYRISFKKD